MIVLFLFLVAVCFKKAEAGSCFFQIEVLLLKKKVIKASYLYLYKKINKFMMIVSPRSSIRVPLPARS